MITINWPKTEKVQEIAGKERSYISNYLRKRLLVLMNSSQLNKKFRMKIKAY